MTEKLQITDAVRFDDSVTKEEYHTYYSTSNNFNLNDEIRISIRHQDIYTAPCDSYIYIEGNFKESSTAGETGTCALTNNAYAFLFDQIRYEINGVEVDRCDNPGITSTIKALVSYNDNESKALQVAGWNPESDTVPTVSDDKFSASIPLSFLLGFAEDYRKVIVNVNQDLILLRSRTDANCYKNSEANGTKTATMEITKVEWHVPHIEVNDETRLKLLKTLNNNKPLYVPFRKWQLHLLPSLRANKTDIWPVKTSTNLERPRFVIVAFQTNKRDNIHENASHFDHVSLTNLKLHLNAQSFPYDKMNLQMSDKRYTTAYRMYAAFQSSYYNRTNQPILDYGKFYNRALYVIDCSKQTEAVKSSTVDVKLEMECERVFNVNTAAYCLILHDNIVEYTPLTGIVKKIV